jgi:hypothetical protein
MSITGGYKGIGSKKHGKSGKVHNQNHFTGAKGSGTKRKRKSSRKSRKLKRGTAVNKYGV